MLTRLRLGDAATLAAIAIVLAAWLGGGALGHDEAAYAIGGDALVHGAPSPWLYRSVGMHALAAFGVLAGGSELALRVPTVLFAIGFVLAARRVGRLFGRDRGAWTVAVIAGMHGVILRGHELLSDLPSTTCLLAAIALLVEELERDAGPRWRVVLAAPALAAAFYLRYASCVPIALVGATIAIVWGRRVLALPILATAAGLALLLVPHALQAIAATGSPLGIVRYSAEVPSHRYVGDGLVTYLFSNPFVMYGVIAAPVLVAGLASVMRPSPSRRPAIALWLVATSQIVALGFLSQAMARYIYLALTLLVVLGVDAIARAAAHRPPPRSVARAAVPLVALGWLGVFVATVALGLRGEDWKTPIVDAATIVRADAAARPCHVVSRRFAQLMWYSGCASGNFWPVPEELDLAPRVYGVWFPGTEGAPEPEAFLRADGAPLTIVDVANTARLRVARLTRDTRPPPAR
ncbi:MAG: glycosyltransferase family 39 protein [Deltaproteobacteria bacterium]|nr:glycosyltransferase family 39 protein [Deltaproteobacteria bacterium]